MPWSLSGLDAWFSVGVLSIAPTELGASVQIPQNSADLLSRDAVSGRHVRHAIFPEEGSNAHPWPGWLHLHSRSSSARERLLPFGHCVASTFGRV
jgi:hypothetical protein